MGGSTADGQPWQAPDDLDPEVLALCQAMNAWPGVFTTSSCCGHGRDPYMIFFMAESLDDLPGLLYWFDACHTGQYGWQVRAYTDCAADHVTLMLEGPSGGYEAAAQIAKYIQDDLGERRNGAH